jgi:hypothetical protein
LRVYHEAMLETRGSATVRQRGVGMQGEGRRPFGGEPE